MLTLLPRFLPFMHAAKRRTSDPLSAAAPVLTGSPPWIQLKVNPDRPPIALFSTRQSALEKARQLGATWKPIAYACGYLVTNGWSFYDAKGRLTNFCPLPPKALASIRDLVIRLKREQVPAGELPVRILHSLRRETALAGLSPARFEGACFLTLLRIDHPVPEGAKDDWLTAPGWALALPRDTLPEMPVPLCQSLST